ncbi:MAG TPA: class I SAM-dependent methyltransferase [Candidatus Limnocylindrales bacterium]|nr:class I SAM-dependent methyltransferase [Candidatus Limnocylindrales bacterium]
MPESAADALARLYDLDLSEDPGDLDLYLALAGQTGGPILELAVGSGRLAVPLAADGYDVTGVDLDHAMLRRARATADALGATVARRLTLTHGDARTIRLPSAGSFQLACIPLNSIFLVGGRADQAAAVATLAAHLAPGGLAVVDCWLPDAEDLARYDGRVVLEWVREEPGTGRTVTKTGAAVWDPTTSTVRLTTVFEAGLQGESPVRWVRVDSLRLVGPDELAAMAETAGLRVEAMAGDYELGPLELGAERVILLARRP